MALPVLGFGQIVRDGTIGPGQDVQPEGPNFVIGAELGARAGTNLFHSFSEFNIVAGESATFTGDAAIANVISRVTGTSGSSIDGLLRSRVPNADLYIINPRGIVFGPDAQVDVDGAFHASTTSTLDFRGGESFSTQTGTPPILSHATPSSFGFLGPDAGPITLNGTIMTKAESVSLTAPTIELAQGAQIGTKTGDAMTGDITLRAGERISFSGEGDEGHAAGLLTNATGRARGGHVNVTAPVVDFRDGAFVLAGTSSDGKGGDIHIVAGQRVRLSGIDAVENPAPAVLSTFRDEDASGEGGSITVDAPVVEFHEGAIAQSRAGGDITVVADQRVTLAGTTPNGDAARLTTVTGSSLAAGDIDVQAPVVELKDGATLSTATLTSGEGGSIFVRAAERLSMSGAATLSALVGSEASGDGGDVTVEAGELTLDDGADIFATSLGEGAAGNITLTIRGDASFSGFDGDGVGSLVASAAFGTADAGSVSIEARTVNLADTATLSTQTSGPGAGGALTIVASERVVADGRLAPGRADPGFGGFVTVGSSGEGDAGSLNVRAPIVELRDGAAFSSTGDGSGAAGDIHVVADELKLHGTGLSRLPSLINSNSDGPGDAGSIRVDAKRIEFNDGAGLLSSANGEGAAGHITISADEAITLSGAGQFEQGSFLTSASRLKGDAGNVSVHAPVITLRDGASIVSSTRGTGNAGDVALTARERLTLSGTSVTGINAHVVSESVTPEAGDAGTVRVRAGSVHLRDGGALSSLSLSASGAGGNVEVVVDNELELSGISAQARSARLLAGTNGVGDGGEIKVRARSISLRDGAHFSTSTSGLGAGGEIDVEATESVTLSGPGLAEHATFLPLNLARRRVATPARFAFGRHV